MSWEKVKKHLHPRDVIRNVIVYDFVRSIILAVLKHMWPDYAEIVLDVVALSSAWLDSPETRSWPRVVVSAIVAEILRALLYHH